MSLALYLDEHIPLAITDGLRRRGVDVLTVQEDEQTGVSDLDLLDRATKGFSGVIYAHQLRVPIGQCIIELELLSTSLEPEDFANCVQFLPL